MMSIPTRQYKASQPFKDQTSNLVSQIQEPFAGISNIHLFVPLNEVLSRLWFSNDYKVKDAACT